MGQKSTELLDPAVTHILPPRTTDSHENQSLAQSIVAGHRRGTYHRHRLRNYSAYATLPATNAIEGWLAMHEIR